MSDEGYIHIRNWPKFQHRDTVRGTKAMPWIRDWTAQLNDQDWLALGFADRGLLQSLRLEYAVTRGRGIVDTTTNLTRLLGQRVYRSQLERLNDAGFIEFSASKLLETGWQPAGLVEKRREPSKEGSLKREPAKSARAREPDTSDYRRAENMTRNAGWQYEPIDFLAELDKFDLDPGQRHDLEQLRTTLLNGTQTEDPNW